MGEGSGAARAVRDPSQFESPIGSGTSGHSCQLGYSYEWPAGWFTSEGGNHQESECHGLDQNL